MATFNSTPRPRRTEFEKLPPAVQRQMARDYAACWGVSLKTAMAELRSALLGSHSGLIDDEDRADG